MTTTETNLRALWTSRGISPAEQDRLIAEITAKTQPGTTIGPFKLGGIPQTPPLPNSAPS